MEARAERSTRVHWFGCSVRLPSPQGLASGGNSRGDEASAAAQPATGGRSRRHDRRCFGRLEQEDQRLKKHYGRWMDIVRSLELESFILTKLTKHSVPVNLVGLQVSLPPRRVPASKGSILFLCVIRRHFRWVRAHSGGNVLFSKYNGPFGWSQQSGGNIFFVKYGASSGGSLLQVEE